MAISDASKRRALPSVDDVLHAQPALLAIERFGRPAVVNAIRIALAEVRAGGASPTGSEHVASVVLAKLEVEAAPRLKPVYNLTGTVLHTNLGRSLIAESGVEAAINAMRNSVALEFNIESGHRGERDDLIRGLLCELTGAEDATVVNNNAAAVMLVLNTFSRGREAIVSRGELIEIGGAFRMPEIMGHAGAKLVEIGTTNRTHATDYVDAITPRTGLILKVHTSNYRIEGFTKEITARELATIARDQGVPLIYDLGSGTLIDLRRFGLAHEPTVAEAIADGADLVTFSGDKLLGGPQAGFIVGRKELLTRINRNPMKRALRVDKIRFAVLEATLRLYRDPDRLAQRLPTLRLLSRPKNAIETLAYRVKAVLAAQLNADFLFDVVECTSQIGSGALPLEAVPSAGIAIRTAKLRGAGRILSRLAAALRQLPVPVIGRIEDQSLILDLRCLEDEAGFVANLDGFTLDSENDATASRA